MAFWFSMTLVERVDGQNSGHGQYFLYAQFIWDACNRSFREKRGLQE